jgi:cbb3-type cytochrome oxidase maturation protein
MEVIFIVLPLATLMAGIALFAFFWAAHKGQFDDLDTPSLRAVFDDAEALVSKRARMTTNENKGAASENNRPASGIDHL